MSPFDLEQAQLTWLELVLLDDREMLETGAK